MPPRRSGPGPPGISLTDMLEASRAGMRAAAKVLAAGGTFGPGGQAVAELAAAAAAGIASVGGNPPTPPVSRLDGASLEALLAPLLGRHAPAPRQRKRRRSSDQKAEAEKAAAVFPEAEKMRIWRCHYQLGIAIRAGPDLAAPQTGEVVVEGEVFRASQERRGPGRILYLELADGRGWVFDRKSGLGNLCRRVNLEDFAYCCRAHKAHKQKSSCSRSRSPRTSKGGAGDAAGEAELAECQQLLGTFNDPSGGLCGGVLCKPPEEALSQYLPHVSGSSLVEWSSGCLGASPHSGPGGSTRDAEGGDGPRGGGPDGGPEPAVYPLGQQDASLFEVAPDGGAGDLGEAATTGRTSIAGIPSEATTVNKVHAAGALHRVGGLGPLVAAERAMIQEAHRMEETQGAELDAAEADAANAEREAVHLMVLAEHAAAAARKAEEESSWTNQEANDAAEHGQAEEAKCTRRCWENAAALEEQVNTERLARQSEVAAAESEADELEEFARRAEHYAAATERAAEEWVLDAQRKAAKLVEDARHQAGQRSDNAEDCMAAVAREFQEAMVQARREAGHQIAGAQARAAAVEHRAAEAVERMRELGCRWEHEGAVCVTLAEESATSAEATSQAAVEKASTAQRLVARTADQAQLGMEQFARACEAKVSAAKAEAAKAFQAATAEAEEARQVAESFVEAAAESEWSMHQRGEADMREAEERMDAVVRAMEEALDHALAGARSVQDLAGCVEHSAAVILPAVLAENASKLDAEVEATLTVVQSVEEVLVRARAGRDCQISQAEMDAAQAEREAADFMAAAWEAHQRESRRLEAMLADLQHAAEQAQAGRCRAEHAAAAAAKAADVAIEAADQAVELEALRSEEQESAVQAAAVKEVCGVQARREAAEAAAIAALQWSAELMSLTDEAKEERVITANQWALRVEEDTARAVEVARAVMLAAVEKEDAGANSAAAQVDEARAAAHLQVQAALHELQPGKVAAAHRVTSAREALEQQTLRAGEQEQCAQAAEHAAVEEAQRMEYEQQRTEEAAEEAVLARAEQERASSEAELAGDVLEAAAARHTAAAREELDRRVQEAEEAAAATEARRRGLQTAAEEEEQSLAVIEQICLERGERAEETLAVKVQEAEDAALANEQVVFEAMEYMSSAGRVLTNFFRQALERRHSEEGDTPEEEPVAEDLQKTQDIECHTSDEELQEEWEAVLAKEQPSKPKALAKMCGL